MRYRIRWGALLLAGWLALSLTACHTEEESTSDPTVSAESTEASEVDHSAEMYALYTKAQEKAATFTGSDITLTGSYTVSTATGASVTNVELSWQSMPSETQPEESSDLTASDTSGTVIDVAYTDHLTASITSGGSQSQYELYYDGGVMYREENGQKSRQNVARSTALKDTALYQILPLSEAAFESPIVATVEGNTLVSLPLPGDMLSDALLAETGAPCYILGSLADPEQYTFQNVTVKLTFRSDGALTGYDLYYVMNANDEAQTTLTVSMAAVFNQPNQNVTVTLPDLEAYEDEALQNDLNSDAYDAMPVIVDALFDADGNRVPNYNAIYNSLCKTYSKTVVDTVISWFETQS